MLVLGRAFTTVAKAMEIDPRTLYRWRQDKAFAEALHRRREQVWGEACDRLRGLVNPSLDVMEQHLAQRYDRAQFRAASAVLRLVNIGRVGSA